MLAHRFLILGRDYQYSTLKNVDARVKGTSPVRTLSVSHKASKRFWNDSYRLRGRFSPKGIGFCC